MKQVVIDGFLDAKPDLSGSIFSAADLSQARDFFRDVFLRYAPDWKNTPSSVFANLWRQTTTTSVERLIDVARLLFDLEQGGITPESEPAFGHKIKQLLRCRGENQFEELLTELRVGALFAVRAGPVAWEPLVRPLDYKASYQPPSPDFAIRLPGGDILIEATTLRVGVLDNWDRAMVDITKRVKNAVLKAGLSKELEIHAPLRIRADELNSRLLGILLSEMKTQLNGSATIELGPVSARFVWREMMRIELPVGVAADDQPSLSGLWEGENFAAVIGSGVSLNGGFASKTIPVLGVNAEEILVKSIRETIRGKRAQFTIQMHSVLVIQPSSWAIPAGYLAKIVETRIWPNPEYSWLTGLGVLQARKSYRTNELPTHLHVSWNPNAKEPKTPALHDLVTDNVWFSGGLRVHAPHSAGSLQRISSS